MRVGLQWRLPRIGALTFISESARCGLCDHRIRVDVATTRSAVSTGAVLCLLDSAARQCTHCTGRMVAVIRAAFLKTDRSINRASAAQQLMVSLSAVALPVCADGAQEVGR
jgi:hypothetical protein